MRSFAKKESQFRNFDENLASLTNFDQKISF